VGGVIVRSAYRAPVRATAAPRRFPFFDHRTLADVDPIPPVLRLQSAHGRDAAHEAVLRGSSRGQIQTPKVLSPAAPAHNLSDDHANSGGSVPARHM
jgi:hypothetical protein